MGLAASQGRMLLLTARKSDLEFRAQQISQKRLILSQQLEQISSEYEEATSNRQMKIRLYSDEANGKEVTNRTVNLTYKYLVSGAVAKGASVSGLQKSADAGTDGLEYASNAAYRLVDADNAIVVSDISELPGYTKKSKFNENGDILDENGTVMYTKGEDGKYRRKNGVDENGNPIWMKYTVDQCLKYTSSGANGTTDGPNYLQDCLRNGKYLIQKSTTDPDTEETSWHGVSWDATSNISDSYYQDDDDAAKAKYDRLQTQVQNQDKKLELELDNVETQRSAVKTEMDSVDKVISDNVEKTFNAFG